MMPIIKRTPKKSSLLNSPEQRKSLAPTCISMYTNGHALIELVMVLHVNIRHRFPPINDRWVLDRYLSSAARFTFSGATR